MLRYMVSQICSVPDCRDPQKSRGWCNRHYLRWRYHGHTRLPEKPTRSDKLWARVDASGDCWNWVGFVTSQGYGQFGRNEKAHRAVWETLVGELAPGRQLDHLCRNRRCVNPDHLEPVSREENLARGIRPGRKRQTHCKRGHSLVTENLYVRPDGERCCSECRRLRHRGEI